MDLGLRPSLEEYRRNVDALLVLARYSGFLARPRITVVVGSQVDVRLPTAPVRVVRSSLASPWVSVLADLAEHSAPVGYGAAALVTLQRILQMVMTWQRHRQDIVERELQLTRLRTSLSEDLHGSASVRAVLGKLSTQTEADKRGKREEEDSVGGSEDHMTVPVVDRAVQAAIDLGDILATELIEPDDPRAVGEAE